MQSVYRLPVSTTSIVPTPSVVFKYGNSPVVPFICSVSLMPEASGNALVSWSSSLLLDVRFLSSSNIFLKFRWSRPHFKIRGRFLCALLTRGV